MKSSVPKYGTKSSLNMKGDPKKMDTPTYVEEHHVIKMY